MAGQNDIDIKITTAIDAAKSIQTLGELRKSMRELKGLALTVGEGSEGFDKLTDAIGESQFKLKELNETITLKTGNSLKQLTNSLGGITRVGVGGFEAVEGASALFGDEVGEASKKMVQLQGLMVFERGLSELSTAGEQLKRSFGTIASVVGSVYQKANTQLISFGNALKNVSFKDIQNGVTSFASSFVSAFSNLGATVTTFFSEMALMIESNPLGLILIAITAILVAFQTMSDTFKPLTMIFDGIKKAIMFVVQAVKDFLDLMGLTHFAAKKKFEETLDYAKKEGDAVNERYENEITIAKAAGKEVELLETQKLLATLKYTSMQINAYKQLELAGDELSKEQKKDLAELTKSYNKNLTEQAASIALNEKKIEDNKKKADLKARKLEAQLRNDKKELAKIEIEEAGDAAFKTSEANVISTKVIITNYKDQIKQLQAKNDAEETTLRQNLDNRDEILAIEKKIKEEESKLREADASEIKSYDDEKKVILKKSAQEITADNKKGLDEKLAESKIEIDSEIILQKQASAIKKAEIDSTLSYELRTGVDKQKARDKALDAVKEEDQKIIDLAEKKYKMESQYIDATVKDTKQASAKKILAEQEFRKTSLDISMQSLKDFKSNQDEALKIYKKISTDKFEVDKITETENYQYQQELAKLTIKNTDELNAKLKELALGHYQVIDKIISDQSDAELEHIDKSTIEADKQLVNKRINLRKKSFADEFILIDEQYKLQADERIEQMHRELSAADLTEKQIRDIKDRYRDLDLKAEQAEADAKLVLEKKSIKDIAGAETQLASTINSLTDQITQNKLDAVNKQYQTEIDVATKAGQDTTKLKSEQIIAQNALQQKQFNTNKAFSLASTTIAGIESVVNALDVQPYPVGLALAVSAAAASAINIAKIASTTFNAQDPNAGGASSVSATVPTGNFSAPTFFGLGQGGSKGSTPNPTPQKVYVVESDITKSQQKVAVIQSRASTSLTTTP